MTLWSRIFPVLLVAVTLAVFALPGTATARYVVEPVTEEYTGEWHDFEEITFWDLPLRVMIVHFLLMVLPGIPYMGELFYALSLLLPFGFRRVMRHNILDDDFRRDLYRQITANPGIGTTELQELTGASRGRLRYHLDMLIREGKVAVNGGVEVYRFRRNKSVHLSQ
jgi:predicted transcriptional regulator